MKERVLVIVRHAHRSKRWGREADNGLSPKGWAQARKVARWLEERFPGRRPALISSPKVRCVETLEHYARSRALKIRRDPRLEELFPGNAVLKPLRAFAAEWRRSKKALMILCSHGDAIPELVRLLAGVPVELKKGGVLVLSLREGERLSRLLWIAQELA